MDWQGKKGEWYVIVQFCLFALIAFGPRSSSFLPLWSADVLGLVWPLGIVLLGVGLVVIVLALLGLGSNLSALPHPKASAELVQTGLYAFVRHPIYSGLIASSLGWAMIRGSSLMLIYALILFIFFEFKTRREEQQLERVFVDYAEYKQRVKKLIPFVY